MSSFRKQQKMQATIDALFSGLDDPILKQALLTVHAGADPKILEEMQKQEQQYLEELTKHMEIVNASEVVGETKVILSNDIVDGNDTGKSTNN
jgi:hypothetical protein